MAARTSQANDNVTLLARGPVTVSAAGFTDPQGNPWILMNDTAAAVNGLIVTNGATGTGPTISVGGAAADANRGLTIVGNGTGAVTIGSSVSPVTLAGAQSVSSNLTVTGTVSASTFNSCGLVTFRTTGPSSALLITIQLGSSGPRISFGASTPTASANSGDLFLNTGGSSGQIFAVGLANGGTASSSNWATYTPT